MPSADTARCASRIGHSLAPVLVRRLAEELVPERRQLLDRRCGAGDRIGALRPVVGVGPGAQDLALRGEVPVVEVLDADVVGVLGHPLVEREDGAYRFAELHVPWLMLPSRISSATELVVGSTEIEAKHCLLYIEHIDVAERASSTKSLDWFARGEIRWRRSHHAVTELTFRLGRNRISRPWDYKYTRIRVTIIHGC